MKALARRPKFCRRHPTYQLKRKPRSECGDCWRAWELKRELTAALAEAAQAVEKLFHGEQIEVRASWKNGIGDIRAYALRVLGK